MSVLIGMAVYSTETNGKDECLLTTLQSLFETVGIHHNVVLSVNSMTEKTMRIIAKYEQMGVISRVIYNEANIGTAEAINKVWKGRKPGQHCIKMDDDVKIYTPGWVELMIEAIKRDPTIGIIGLKRKDCCESPENPDHNYRSKYLNVPHVPGEKWIVVEQCKHIIGTCQMYNSALLDKIGYLYQPSLYGYDDVLASYRSELAGFKNVFLPQIEIDHVDEGKTEYQGWKERHAGEQTQNVIKIVDEYINGTRLIYYQP
jgi:GT2 family glycosyltransferase